MFNARTFLFFVRCTFVEVLNPVFQSVFCKDENDIVEIFSGNTLLLSFFPKPFL